jgi:hypothetical protein
MRHYSYWDNKINAAERYYKEWVELFKCEQLEKYYEGFQWGNLNNISLGIRPYTINLIYSTIETKLANIILNYPEFDVAVKPKFSDWDQETAYASAQLKGDALNTVIDNPNLHYVDNIKLAALDYFFRFAVIEVGYATDWINPNKKTYMDSDVNKRENSFYSDTKKDKIIEDLEVPVNERLFFAWRPARRFRVSAADSPFLDNSAWYGYHSFYYRSALEKLKNIKFSKEIEEYQNPQFSPDYAGPSRIIGSVARDETESAELSYLISNNEVCKVWTLWNNRTGEKELVLDKNKRTIWSEPFSYCPLATHRANYRLRGWYPIPPVWYWISPQNEINEAREQIRNYRRRFKRKFWVLKNKVETTELDKLSNEVDGEVITVKEREAIGAIGNSEVGVTVQYATELGFSDFNHVSGSSQVRESDRETATKSKIISLKEQVRENVERQNFDKFVCETGRLGLVIMHERFSEDMWIKYSTDPGEDFMGEINSKGPIFKRISSTQLDDGYDFTVSIRVNNASAAQTQEEMQKFVAFLSIVNQFPQIMFSPVLIREAAYKVGYRNEKVIKQMQQAALLQMMGQAQMAQQNINGQNGSANNASKSAIANSVPDPMSEINNQLNAQV